MMRDYRANTGDLVRFGELIGIVLGRYTGADAAPGDVRVLWEDEREEMIEDEELLEVINASR